MKTENQINDAVKTGGSYEIIKDRLLKQSSELSSKVEQLNNIRKKEFGSSKNEILSKVKVRTENNCNPVDMAQINGDLLVGYDINIGIKNKIEVQDVFSLYKLKEENNSIQLTLIPFEETFFFNDIEFKTSFNELMTYYKGAKLSQINRKNDILFISFQTGSSSKDLKVYKFKISKNNVKMITDRAYDEFAEDFNRTHCFEWIETTREDHVLGIHPHVSIKNKVFVETVGGDLTIKVDNNTESGNGIYQEAVKDHKQVLEDAKIFYAELGDLILLNIKPYGEKERYFIFNSVTETVLRVDSLKNSCQALPDNHGVIFPDGVYLSNGEHKIFSKESDNLKYLSTYASPNGEDYLYVFFDFFEKCYVLYSYNLINKKIDNPIHAHGYSLYENGNIYIFRLSDNAEHSKIHPLTIWKTPFYSDEYFLELEKLRNMEERDRFFLNIGNADLVSAISELYDIVNFCKKDDVTTSVFEGIIKNSQTIIDNYHWLNNSKVFEIETNLKSIIHTSELIVDEFEKVKSIRKQSISILEKTQEYHHKLVTDTKLLPMDNAAAYVIGLGKINKHIGHLISIKNERYIDLDAIELMHEEIKNQKIEVNKKLLKLLQDKRSFNSYFDSIKNIEFKMNSIEKVVDIEPLEKELVIVNDNISTINNEINDIESEDSTITSQILDHVSEVYAKLNQTSAKLKNLKKGFLSKEAKIEFASQFKLLSQSVSNAIGKSTTPEKCDHEYSLLVSQVEKLESRFSDFDDYLTEIFNKRNEISDTFENHKQKLINNIQTKIGNIVKAANICLDSISKKVENFDDIDSLNTYFSSDSMVLKVMSLIENIKDVGGSVQAEDVESKLVKIKDLSMRSLRDNKDIFKDGGNIMVMGKHDFAVNKSPLDLTILNQNGKMVSHLTSTDYYKEVYDSKFDELSYLWESELPSESKEVYRAEYLAYIILSDAINNRNNLNIELLLKQSSDKELLKTINEYASARYKDNYIKGVHDYDANIILSKIVSVYANAGDLVLSQEARCYAMALLLNSNDFEDESLKNIIKNAFNLKMVLNNPHSWNSLINKKAEHVATILKDKSNHLIKEISEAYYNILISRNFEYSINSKNLNDQFNKFLTYKKLNISLTENSIDNLEMIDLWINSFILSDPKLDNLKPFSKEAAIIYLRDHKSELKNNLALSILKEKDIDLNIKISGLIGDHPSIEDGEKQISLDSFLSTLKFHDEVFYPSFEAFSELKQKVSKEEKEKLCLEDFKSKPLTSFVRNKLITDVYFPMIGDNFAKQMGTVGANKRSDLMGLLLLISPPGYGKTTLIEYIANKLGLVFVKINCPSIGHSVKSLDPEEASDSTSKKEINKINLAFEMGSNVLLYLDDIQHTNPEFLQKFISLCDGTRRIEGVWDGKTKTYDMRGKRFSVVMAGNPYTETGETFKIPDMLANRADIYNLGDILGGKEDIFKLSYIENSLTSNKVIAPLATRGMDDVYKFVKMAQGENIPINELDHNYSPAEANEIVSIIKHMLKIREYVYLVNKEYIKSAAANDKYREEPPFKLQGSYRNMNKMTEKLVSVMNDDDIVNMVIDHYTGESQTLTNGAESNMLKLKDLMGVLTEKESSRWKSICLDFNKNRKMGGDDTDSGKMIANQLAEITQIMTLINEKKEKTNDIIKKEPDNLYYEKLDYLVDKIKENQSEEQLINLFSKRIEDLQNGFISIIDKKDKQFIDTFEPMIKYFETALQKYEKDKNSKK